MVSKYERTDLAIYTSLLFSPGHESFKDTFKSQQAVMSARQELFDPRDIVGIEHIC